MPHVPKMPPGTRFFARIDRFHCECPSCGSLIVAAKDPGEKGRNLARLRRKLTTYNPITAVLYCPHCRKSYGVGLVLWPMHRGSSPTRIPTDHQPTRRQMRELATKSYGIWTEEIKRQGDELNLAIDEPCSCPAEGWHAGCPVHGWKARAAREELGDSE